MNRGITSLGLGRCELDFLCLVPYNVLSCVFHNGQLLFQLGCHSYNLQKQLRKISAYCIFKDYKRSKENTTVLILVAVKGVIYASFLKLMLEQNRKTFSEENKFTLVGLLRKQPHKAIIIFPNTCVFNHFTNRPHGPLALLTFSKSQSGSLMYFSCICFLRVKLENIWNREIHFWQIGQCVRESLSLSTSHIVRLW